MKSKEYSWKWVTADELLSHGPCELLYARTMTATAESDTFLRDGESALDTPIVEFESGVNAGQEFSPPLPVYCRQGLYVDIGTNTIGVFVMWRELGHEERGG